MAKYYPRFVLYVETILTPSHLPSSLFSQLVRSLHVIFLSLLLDFVFRHCQLLLDGLCHTPNRAEYVAFSSLSPENKKVDLKKHIVWHHMRTDKSRKSSTYLSATTSLVSSPILFASSAFLLASSSVYPTSSPRKTSKNPFYDRMKHDNTQ